MDFEKLRKLSERHEVRVDNYRGHKRTPPYYYDSLRHAFSAYFNTFHTQNATYDFYAQGLHGRDVKILKGQLLDEDNTVLTIIGYFGSICATHFGLIVPVISVWIIRTMLTPQIQLGKAVYINCQSGTY